MTADNELPGMWESADFTGGETDMTTDNKDAAFELARRLAVLRSDIQNNDVVYEDDLPEYYNAARKPLEEAFKANHNKHLEIESELRHKLLATQEEVLRLSEAYQRVVEATNTVLPFVVSQEISCNGLKCREPVCSSCSDNTEIAVQKACDALYVVSKALANPPSMEALERKKLEDEYHLLLQIRSIGNMDRMRVVDELIAERKAKLEKMK